MVVAKYCSRELVDVGTKKVERGVDDLHGANVLLSGVASSPFPGSGDEAGSDVALVKTLITRRDPRKRRKRPYRYRNDNGTREAMANQMLTSKCQFR